MPKSWQDVPVNSENVSTTKQKQLRKNPLYVYWECQTLYSTSYLKLDNTHLLHLFVDMYILKFFLKKWFCKVRFLL